jgi:hypothetical protein
LSCLEFFEKLAPLFIYLFIQLALIQIAFS